MKIEVKNEVISGRILNLSSLKPEEINVWDIIWPLSLSNRYNGHTPFPFDVLSHSLMVYEFYCKYEKEPKLKESIAMLLHDAAESYIGDIVHPLKIAPEFNFFHELEEQIMEVILKAFGVEYSEIDWKKVYLYDKTVTDVEFRTFFPFLTNTFKPEGMFEVKPEDKKLIKADVVGVYNLLEVLTFTTIKDEEARKRLFELPDTLKNYVEI